MRRVKPPKELNLIRALGWTPQDESAGKPCVRAYRGMDRTPWRGSWSEVWQDIMARKPVRGNTDYSVQSK